MQEELEKIVIYSDEEIKRLTQAINKAEQREKNQALYFQSRMYAFYHLVLTLNTRMKSIEHDCGWPRARKAGRGIQDIKID